MDTIHKTLSMMNEAPLTAVRNNMNELMKQPQKAIVAKEEEAIGVMEKQFKKGLVSEEAMSLLISLQQNLDSFNFVGAEDVYKKLNLEFWKVHKEWLLPLKHFLGLCKKLSSWGVYLIIEKEYVNRRNRIQNYCVIQ